MDMLYRQRSTTGWTGPARYLRTPIIDTQGRHMYMSGNWRPPSSSVFWWMDNTDTNGIQPSSTNNLRAIFPIENLSLDVDNMYLDNSILPHYYDWSLAGGIVTFTRTVYNQILQRYYYADIAPQQPHPDTVNPAVNALYSSAPVTSFYQFSGGDPLEMSILSSSLSASLSVSRLFPDVAPPSGATMCWVARFAITADVTHSFTVSASDPGWSTIPSMPLHITTAGHKLAINYRT